MRKMASQLYKDAEMDDTDNPRQCLGHHLHRGQKDVPLKASSHNTGSNASPTPQKALLGQEIGCSTLSLIGSFVFALRLGFRIFLRNDVGTERCTIVKTIIVSS